MDQVILTTTPSIGLTDSLLQRMFHIYASTPELSARSKKEIREYYQKKEIIFAQAESKVVGWLIRSPLSPSLYEISGAYVEQGFRSKGIFTSMLNKALEPDFQYMIVTFIPDFSEYLIKECGFRRSSFYEVAKLTKWVLVLKRLHPQRLISIMKHLSAGRANYLLKNMQYE